MKSFQQAQFGSFNSTLQRKPSFVWACWYGKLPPAQAKAIALQVETTTTIMPNWLRFGSMESLMLSLRAASLKVQLFSSLAERNKQKTREETKHLNQQEGTMK